MRRTSILNFKGGVGKTSLTTNVGHYLASQGKRVLIIDGDRQGNASTVLLRTKERPALTLTHVLKEEIPLRDAIYEAASVPDVPQYTRENLYIVPSDFSLDKAVTYLKETPAANEALREQLDELEGQIDIVLFDHAGAYTQVMYALLLASHDMLIPCELEPFSVDGIADIIKKLKGELRRHSINNAGIIPYNTDYRRDMTSSYLEELRTTFGDLVLPEIHTDSTVSNAQDDNLTVFEYDQRKKRKSQAAQDYKRLGDYLITEGEQVHA
jgi:chromosome partitioning protein